MKRSICSKLAKAVSCALVLAFLAAPVCAADVIVADDEAQLVSTRGLQPIPQDVVDAHKASLLGNDGIAPFSLDTSFPSSIDLSTSMYFPTIADQGGISSCAAFAVVYYQYTFEVNMLYTGLSSKVQANQYSPNWPYYALIKDDSPEEGLSIDIVYDFLKEHGALKWTDDPYDNTAFDYSMPWPTSKEKMREAMNIRLYNWNAIEISHEGTAITSNQDTDLDEIKAALNYNKLLTVGAYWDTGATNFYSNADDPNKDKTIFYRCGVSSDGGKHALTIVGYDDNVTYDINGDGTIQAGERGAFKIANSHGTGFGDDGFFWLMYDALNGVSSVTGDWDDQSTRSAAFSYEVSYIDEDLNIIQEIRDNLFTYIYAEEKEPLLLVELNLKPHHRHALQLFLLKKQYEINPHETSYGMQAYSTLQNRTLIFDYDDLTTAFDDNSGSIYRGIRLYCSGNPEGIVLSSYLVDNLGNIISEMELESKQEYVFNYSSSVSFEYGDVNYDGVLTTADTSLIMSYISKSVVFSNAQIQLADYNSDGKVNLTDVGLINNAIS